MLAIASDHAAQDLKNQILAYVRELGYDITDESGEAAAATEYPIIAERTAHKVAAGIYDRAFLICGTGIGMSLAANKVPGIRAACCSEPYTAMLSRQHNDCQILCFGARVVGSELAKLIVKAFLEAEFQGGRHQRRVDLITQIEAGSTPQ